MKLTSNDWHHCFPYYLLDHMLFRVSLFCMFSSKGFPKRIDPFMYLFIFVQCPPYATWAVTLLNYFLNTFVVWSNLWFRKNHLWKIIALTSTRQRMLNSHIYFFSWYFCSISRIFPLIWLELSVIMYLSFTSGLDNVYKCLRWWAFVEHAYCLWSVSSPRD